jgi:hypothetical protein
VVSHLLCHIAIPCSVFLRLFSARVVACAFVHHTARYSEVSSSIRRTVSANRRDDHRHFGVEEKLNIYYQSHEQDKAVACKPLQIWGTNGYLHLTTLPSLSILQSSFAFATASVPGIENRRRLQDDCGLPSSYQLAQLSCLGRPCIGSVEGWGNGKQYNDACR